MVTLDGELGSGKTAFVRAACAALGVLGPVTSPSYTIGQLHQGRARLVAHLDLYRSPPLTEESWADLEPYFHGTVAFVEWPSAGAAFLPPARAALHLALAGPAARLIRLETRDPMLAGPLADSLARYRD